MGDNRRELWIGGRMFEGRDLQTLVGLLVLEEILGGGQRLS